MSLCIVYLASPRAFRIGDHLRFTMLQSSLAVTRQCFPTTDVYIFHEDFTEEDKVGLPGVKEFLQVDFRGYESQKNPALTASYGYLMMCRFFSGVFQTYPFLQRYTHVMRLDDDSFFQPPVPVVTSEIFSYDYTYRSLFWETRDQQSLYEFTLQFLKRQLGLSRFQLRFPALVARLRTQNFLRDGRYTGVAPYNNFHIASVRLWSHPIVRAYFGEIEARQGILREGWLDANIHAMVLYVLSECLPLRIFHWSSFGYRHNKHVSELGTQRSIFQPELPWFPAVQTPPSHSAACPSTPPEPSPDAQEEPQ